MRILVTGGDGFIGRRLVKALLEEEHEVSIFDFAVGEDILNEEQIRKAIVGMDAVFHLAAVADLNVSLACPKGTLDKNVIGTQNVALACMDEGVRLYFASTCCVYGSQCVHPTTEKALPHPSELYAASKLAAESVVSGLSLTHGLEYNIMRFATVYGPGTRAAMGTHVFMGQALRDEPITVHGDGSQTRTITYVDDLVDGMIALLRSGKCNDVWNISTEEEVSALGMAWDIKAITNSRSPIVFIPQRPGQTMKEQISAAKMLNETGWRAKTPWGRGLEQMYEWYLATHQVEQRCRVSEPAKEGVRS